MLVALWAIFLYAPTERVQGDVQRIFYFHVPMAWVSYLAFFVVFVASIGVATGRRPGWDAVGRSSAEVGVVFTTLVLATGSLWAKPIWGTWWTWDARLTTTLVLWFIYLGYLLLRANVPDEERAARYGAVWGIVGFIDVPIVHFSVELWRTLHPEPVVLRPDGPALPAAMLVTLLVAVVAFTLLYVLMLSQRIQLERVRERLRLARSLVP
ncbi:MAG: cytochrome c biogenesis protein CcsA [Chloroflexi bacterium]|nr:cytochrome c biogenesis protein CcsA [Chloroflexota bacterium]